MTFLARRLSAQLVSSGGLDDPSAVVSWLGAVQAQDYLAGLWAIGLRTERALERDVEQAIADRGIVRTWPMRGTLHFVAAADARWMTELLAPRRVAGAQGRLRSFGIDASVLARARRALVENLEGERTLTRPAAYAALERAKVAAGEQRGLHVLWCLAQQCLICFGPREGKQQTLVLFEDWLPRARRLPREEALAELASRYFQGHGPATDRDLAWWSGLTLTEARLAIVLAGRRLKEERVDGQSHWFSEREASGRSPRNRAYVLPAFDELLVGYADRSAALDAATSRLVIAGGMFRPIVVGSAGVLGTWRRRIERREVVCSIAPFRKPSPAIARASTEALQRYARFVGLDLRVQSFRR